MSIVIAPGFVVSEGDGLTNEHPIVSWDNIVTRTNILSDTVESGHPATNLAHSGTYNFWRAADTTLQYLRILNPSADDVDHVAIAGHNLGTEQIPIAVGYFDTSSPPQFVELVPESLLANDKPAIFRFDPQVLPDIYIQLGVGNAAAQIAVLYAGKLLILPRKLWQGMVPLPFMRVARTIDGISQSGEALGVLQTGEWMEGTVPLSLIDPTYFRDHIADFLATTPTRQFFIAWRPQTYPGDVGYMRMQSIPQPTQESPHGLMRMDWKMRGIV